jgi:mono/diheme cytochrome c family protein
MKKSRMIKYGAVAVFTLLAVALFGGNWLLPGKISTGLTSSAQTLSGAELFKASCARCHSEDGTGGKGPDLTTEKKQAKWKDSDEKLVKKITNGGFGMPKFRDKLKPEEIKAIADFVRSLKK